MAHYFQLGKEIIRLLMQIEMVHGVYANKNPGKDLFIMTLDSSWMLWLAS